MTLSGESCFHHLIHNFVTSPCVIVSNMEKLQNWLKRHGALLKWNSKSKNEVSFEPLTSTIHVFIDERLQYQEKLCTMLHECGHVVCYLRRQMRKRKRIDGCSYIEYFNSTNRMHQGRKRKLAILQDEIAAWDRGEELAARMKIRYSRATLERMRSRSLWTYMPRAAKNVRK